MDSWVKRIPTWVSAIVGLLAIATTVFYSARAGVESAVKTEFERQIANTHSPLNRQIVASITQHERDICEPRWRAVQESLATLSIQNATIDTKLNMLLEENRGY